MAAVTPTLSITSIGAQYGAFILGALSFTIALAWNAAIQNYFREHIKTDTGTARGQFVYAFTLTLIGLIIAYFVIRFGKIDRRVF